MLYVTFCPTNRPITLPFGMGPATLWAPHLLEVKVRNIARIKLGYYTLPQEEGKRLRKLLNFRPVQPASIHASAWETRSIN